VFKTNEISFSIGALCYIYIYILDLQHVLFKFPKYDTLQNSNQSHYKHNVSGNNFLCLIDGNDILLEVVHDRSPKITNLE
jgi:hypothetical protein